MSGLRDERVRQRDHAHRLQVEAEQRLLPVVQAALDDVAARLAAVLPTPDPGAELTAAAEWVDPEDLDQIPAWWVTHIPTILATLRVIYTAAAHATVRRFAGQALLNLLREEPSHPLAVTLTQHASDYLLTAENRLTGVGDTLWEAARAELAAGNLAGDSSDQLAARLREVFARDGQQLGETRAETIARTETIGAWNNASLGTTRALPVDTRPGYKTWLCTMDRRTRPTHWLVDGTTVPLDAQFEVGDVLMTGPHDPTAPPEETINCRCTLVYSDDPEPVPRQGLDRQYLDDAEIQQVIDYFEAQGVTRNPPEAAVAAATLATTSSAAGLGPGAHVRRTPMTPADLVAAARQHDGAMIALVPTAADAERLALPGGEPADQLHLTLAYLGKADDWDEQQRQALIELVRQQAATHPPVEGTAFGAAHWNPNSEYPAWVLNVGGDSLTPTHAGVWQALLAGDWTLPAQHSPWLAHLCLSYDDDPTLVTAMEQRLGPVTFDRLRVAFAEKHVDFPLTGGVDGGEAAARPVRHWHTPAPAALAFEDTQTGDGRVFAPGALRWEGESWPLMHAPQMLGGHDGAVLVGAITTITRDGKRIAGAGVLYPDLPAGAEAVSHLERGAPLGVSVDLDDITLEVVDTRPPEERDQPEEVVASAHLPEARMRPTDGGWMLQAPQLRQRLTAAGFPTSVTAAAGESDRGDGEVLMIDSTDNMLLRITRGRIRGATLVTVPAFADARIVLTSTAATPAGSGDSDSDAGGGQQVGELMAEIVEYVEAAATPVRPGQVADALGLDGQLTRTYLSRAFRAGRLSRPSRGLYTANPAPAPEPEVTAAAVGNTQLPVHPDRDRPWDGQAAAARVMAYAQQQAADSGDPPSRWLRQAFLYQDPDANPNSLSAYKLGYADVINGELRIVARGVFATAGGRGLDAADIPEDDREEIRERICTLYRRLANAFDDDDLVCPWDRDDAAGDRMVASAWAEFQALPPAPAAWFAEPTEEELPPDSGGVHVTDEGRIYGWVAQRGVPHDGFPGQNLTLDDLEPIDLTHFLKARFRLDNGETVPVGPITMNVGHHRDGAECETAACQFDDSRTVAGIVTVGLNDRGMWFSGVAAPWLSSWDLAVFQACQPSYHMQARTDGPGYSLRAVLSVPRPGHPSRLAASAVVDRANRVLVPSSDPEPVAIATAAAALPVDLDALARQVAAAVWELHDERERNRAELEAMKAEMAAAQAALIEQMKAEMLGDN